MSHFLKCLLLVSVYILTCIHVIVAQSITQDKSHICGVNYIGPQSVVTSLNSLDDIKVTNANWVSLVPGRIIQRTDLKLVYDAQKLKWAESMEGIVESIKAAKVSGYKIMLKPHVILEKAVELEIGERDVVLEAEWRGDILPQSEEYWLNLENSYRSYILDLAYIAQEYELELFCIGTELQSFVTIRSKFWQELITEIKSIYSGQLTYSANWDEYEKIKIWGSLDYIGIDAYFPVSKDETPSVRKVVRSWNKIKKKIQEVTERENLPVLFTEYGYRNVSHAGRSPWTHSTMIEEPNYQTQNNLYEAFYKSFWTEDWVVGGFLWNWFGYPAETNQTDFNVNDKPVITIIKQWYSHKLKS